MVLGLNKHIFNTSKITFVIFVFITFKSFILMASSPKPSTINIPKNERSGLTRTEASTTDCYGECANKTKSVLAEYLSQLRVVKEGHVEVHNSAYYNENENNRKQAIIELRKRKANGESLTEEENAILQFGGRMGFIMLCPKVMSNAVYTRIPIKGSDGVTKLRDVAITSGHAAIDEKGNERCSDYKNAKYAANFSFYDGSEGFDYRVVDTDGNTPLNLENSLGRQRAKAGLDFIVFVLDEKNGSIAEDILPDGTQRGYVKFSKNIQQRSKGYFVGLDRRRFSDKYVTYQKCDLYDDPAWINHTCDVAIDTSSSPIGQLENGEITLRGIQSYGEEGDFPIPQLPYDEGVNSAKLNIATSAQSIKEYLDQLK